MQYLFKKEVVVDSEISYTMYEVRGGQLTRIKSVVMSEEKDYKIKCALICQFIAEGSTVEGISKGCLWSPDPVEFFLWLDKDQKLRGWYNDAIRIRDQLVIDKVYENLRKKDYGGKEVEGILKILKELKFNLKKEEGIQENVQVYSPRVKEFGFDS